MGKTCKQSHLSKRQEEVCVSPIPGEIPKLQEGEASIIKCYLDEWKVTIETQMHFNDLIIRFRSIAITAFTTLSSGFIYLYKTETIIISKWVLLLPASLWISAFLLDYFYYYKLLLGSVDYANEKYDESEIAKKYYFFGLTNRINKKVKQRLSNRLIIIFYLVPIIANIFTILFLLK